MSDDGGSYDRTFGDLREVYLEDSWILDVAVADRSMRFVLDAVLTERHSSYQPPTPGEQYCYRRAILTVTSEQSVDFRPSNSPPSRDATGEVDYGNIDTFVLVDWDGDLALGAMLGVSGRSVRKRLNEGSIPHAGASRNRQKSEQVAVDWALQALRRTGQFVPRDMYAILYAFLQAD